ncbi:MAG: esterase-like activity of phytase family protein [Xanthobacteraceae bacterium]
MSGPVAQALRNGAPAQSAAVFAAILIAVVLALSVSRVAVHAEPATATAIEVQAQPLSAFDIRDPSRRSFGLLEFRGGLVLRSRFKHFGGISAIRVAADGMQFIGLSDKGWWLRGRIVYDGNRPSGVADAEMAPLLGADGRPLAAHGWYDSEAIAEDGGTLYVAIERVHQIVRFNYAKDGLSARAQPIASPAALRSLPSNRGIEALVFVPKGLPLAGTLIAISERGLDRSGDLMAFLIGGRTPGTFAVKRSADFDVSDAALLPSGDLLILERKFSWTRGLNVRLRRIAVADIKRNALVDGSVLFEADLAYEIDNMEGLSVHRTAEGETVLTLISDDNFSMIQRTLLLQFTLAEP